MDITEINKQVYNRLAKFKKYNRDSVEIKTSIIEGAGLGLFAKKDIPKGTIIDAYYGRRIGLKEYYEISDYRSAYIMTINDNEFIEAGEEKNFVSYINDACGLTRNTGIRNNCKFDLDQSGKEMLLITTRNIKAGSELFCPYGKSYWNAVKKWYL